jgi:glyoxylase I family protein
VAEPSESPTASPIAGLSHVQLLVSDLSVSADWYCAALGLDRYVEEVEAGYIALRHRGGHFVIVLTGPTDAPSGAEHTTPREDRSALPTGGRLDHLAFAVPDEGALEVWAQHLSDIGILHPEVVLENGNPSLQLRDPDGIAIEMVAPGSPFRLVEAEEATPG